MLIVPEEFAVTTIEREGTAGREWIHSLPRLVKALCERWGLVLDGPAMHGYLSLVVPVRRGNELCVLKLSWISEADTGQAAALSAWGGRGAVRLLEADPSDGAMLLERLDFSRSLSDVAIEEALTIAGRLLRRHAINAPDGLRMLPVWGADISRSLPERWERYGRPMPRRLLDRAQELAIQLGSECTARLLVNYDLHYGNVLASHREPWLVVDPMVVVGDPEFGIAQLLWTRLEDIEAQGGLDHHFRVLTEAAELEPALARGWTLVRCVDYWLWGLSVGLTYDPARCERIIDWLTAA
jgi:streptomycin 6-kinase